LADIRHSLPPEKNRADSYWTRWVLRPLSIPVAWLCIRLGLSANAVSYLSALVALAGGALLSAGLFAGSGAAPGAGGASFSLTVMITGAFLLNLFAVLDCADGNIARVTGTMGPWGGWADALGGYAAYFAALLGAGMAAETLAGAGGWAFLGGFATGANLLARLVYQSYKNVRRDDAAGDIAGEKKLSENLGVTGVLMPAILIGVVTGYLSWVVLFYAALYGTGAAVSIVRLIIKVERIKKADSGNGQRKG
jgi:phosphatidylglycerophosphate synthase